MIIDHRRQQIMRGRDRMKITCEMQVDIFHRDDLSIATASCPTLHAKTGAKRGFTQAHRCLLANPVQPIPQPNCGCRFAFTSRAWD